VIGIYQSTDMGKNWVRADDDQHQFGHLANAGMIEADRNIYGRVYRSTAGMGIPYMDARTTTAILPTVQRTGIKLFPNPFNSAITLQLDESKVKTIQIYNLTGSLLQTILPVQPTIRFGENFKAGVYLVKVSGEKNTTTLKIIKM
jgi:hypothetical protein